MKLIHCADVHLGAKIDSFPKEVAEERRGEVRNSFYRMVEYAKANGVAAILLCGDVFDRDNPFKKDSNFFYDVVKNTPQIDFLYLRGNHDEFGENREFPNLKTFTTEWTSYAYGDIVISGIELVEENKRAYYSTLDLDEKKRNVVMLHGQVGEEIALHRLQGKGIDYLALGHIHRHTVGELDERGRYAYSGCLEGRGFDETGMKGFILLDVDDLCGSITPTFIPFSLREIVKASVDVTSLDGVFAMAERVRAEVAFKRENIYRIELVGEVDVDVDEFAADVEKNLRLECAYLSVKDCTEKKLDYTLYEGDKTLRGEFVRTVLQCPDYTEEEKKQMIAYGLKALAGREVDA